jgi:hypothetical protein
MPELTQWNNFYVILGSSAGALIGLQFVVVALIADLPHARADAQAGAAFSTPSVVHFGVVLLLSAMSAAPWHGLGSVAIFWGLVGVGGIIYSGIVARRLRKQNAYKPVLEDWLFHLALPMFGYAVLLASSFLVHSYTHLALFMPGTAALVLLFVGIHNAWDAATYHIFVTNRGKQTDKRRK